MSWTCPRCGTQNNIGDVCAVCFTPIPPYIKEMLNDNTISIQDPQIMTTTSSQPFQQPIPGPAPNDYQTATTYRTDHYDGSYSIVDKYNGNELYRVYSDGKVRLLDNRFQNEIGRIDISNISFNDTSDVITVTSSDGNKTLSIKPGSHIVETYEDLKEYYATHEEKIGTIVKKYDYNSTYLSFICEEHHKNDGSIDVYEFVDRKLSKTRTTYADGSMDLYKDGNVVKYDSKGDIIKTEYADGSYEIYTDDKTLKYDAKNDEYLYLYKDGSKAKVKYDSNGNEYLRIYDDGKKVYTNSNNEQLILYPDGTFLSEDKKQNGKYSIDNNGYIICIDNDGNRSIYNREGIIIKTIKGNGEETKYNYDKMTQMVTKNGQTYESRLNHIEYDEEAYTKVLNTLNEIDGNSVISGCTNAISAISSFPDAYPDGGINSIKSSINGHINLIKSLSEMTNYSLLAYQACDSKLTDELHAMIDILFSSEIVGENYKNIFMSVAEDRDNDGILEYKLNTNFDDLHNRIIPKHVYTDKNGNLLYFNNDGVLLGHKGDNIQVNYGGENFTLNFGKNGCAILKDSTGNNISIFGDYNISSCQYGGSQVSFYGDNGLELLNDSRINAVFDKYFPNASIEEKCDYFGKVYIHGCGFVTLTNMVFKKMEGYEEDFQNKFGYPMYDIVYKNNEVSVDYNYEPLILELISEHYGKDFDGNAIPLSKTQVCGMSVADSYLVESYITNKYNIYEYNSDKSFAELSGHYNYSLYDTSGDMYGKKIENLGGHSMTITDVTKDGTTFVSSWGRKYKVELLSNSYLETIEYPMPSIEVTTNIGKLHDDMYGFKCIKTGGKSHIIVEDFDDNRGWFTIYDSSNDLK